MNGDNVGARAVVSNLTTAQVAQRQRDMMPYHVESVDAAFSDGTQATSPGASGTGAMPSAWLNGIGAQFAGHSNGLSGEQRKVNYQKVGSHTSDRDARLLILDRSDMV